MGNTKVNELYNGNGGSGDRYPIPDPTTLTTEQLDRSMVALRELFEARMEATDKAVVLVQTISDRVPILINDGVGNLRELHNERFKSIQTQFTERDIRTEQTARDSKVAVDAALQAAKEAVGEQNKSSGLAISKSEAATTKQIDQISVIINTGQKGLDDKIDDIKSRLTTIEGRTTGEKNVITDTTMQRQYEAKFNLSILAILVSLGALLVMFLKH